MIDQIKEKPLLTVKVIRRKLIEQIYSTRGELTFEPRPLADNEAVVGVLTNGAGTVVRNVMTGNVRLVWNQTILANVGLGDPKDGEARKTYLDSLPQIFID